MIDRIEAPPQSMETSERIRTLKAILAKRTPETLRESLLSPKVYAPGGMRIRQTQLGEPA